VLAVLWAGAMAYVGLQRWPTLPLDLPRNDPQIQAAYNRAVTAHVGRYIVLSLAPPMLVLGLGWLVARSARPRASSGDE
jgi:bacteriorhodopsin